MLEKRMIHKKGLEPDPIAIGDIFFCEEIFPILYLLLPLYIAPLPYRESVIPQLETRCIQMKLSMREYRCTNLYLIHLAPGTMIGLMT